MQRQHYTQRPSGSSRVGSKALTILGALGLAFILASSFHLDGPTDFSSDLPFSNLLMEAQNASAAQYRKEAAGQAACEDLRGFNATASFDADGALYCSAGRTRTLTQAAL